MDQMYSGSPSGHGNSYHDNQEWGFPAQHYQQNLLHDATAWDRDPFHQSDALNGFGGFQGDFQFDGPASQGEVHHDNEQGSQGYLQAESRASQEHHLQEGIDKMIGDGVYQGLLPTQAH